MKTYLEHSAGKFWEITVTGTSHTVRFGKLGSDGQTRSKSFEDQTAAIKSAEKLIRSKEAKGYARSDDSAAPHDESGEESVIEPALRRRIEECLDAYLERAAEVGWECVVRPAATADQIGALEARWGRALPPSYRAFLELANGVENYGPMRLLGTEDQDWAAAQISDLTESWEVPTGDDDGDYDPDTFALNFFPVLVAEGGIGIRHFYTFERGANAEMPVVGWEYGAKEPPRSFIEFLEEEGDLPEPEPEVVEPEQDPPRTVSLDEALASLASGTLPADGLLRAKALEVMFEPPYFVDQPAGALEQAVRTVLQSNPTDEERERWLGFMPRAVEHVALFVGPEPPADNFRWFRKMEHFLASYWDHPEAPRWADIARPYVSHGEQLGHTLARIYARAGRLDDALTMCAAQLSAEANVGAAMWADKALAALRSDESYRDLFRQPPGSEPVESFFGPYEIEIASGIELPPLLKRFLDWLALQPKYSLGWFDAVEVRPFEAQKKSPMAEGLLQLIAFHSKDEIAVEKQSVLALQGDGDTARVVLVYRQACWEVAPTVEGFLRRWATSRTGVSPLDQDGRRTIRYKKTESTPQVASRRGLLGLWLDDEGVGEQEGVSPDLPQDLAKKLFEQHVAETFAGPLSAIAHEMTHFLDNESYFSMRYGLVEKLDVHDCGPRMLEQALFLLTSSYGCLLRTLRLRGSELPLGDVSRLLALRELDMPNSARVDSLAPLAELSHLERLMLGPTKVTDLSPLGGLPMEKLVLGPVESPLDLSPLAKLPALTELCLDGVAIQSAVPLMQCPNLKKVGLWGSKVALSELLPLKELCKTRGGRLSHHHPEV